MDKHLSGVIMRLQHSIASSIGIDEQARADTVRAMHTNNARRAPGYWIQLFLATGIATLGLVLDSTAVVIGAMLVSPLMGPIIELGMGFAVGSSLLVIRAFLRVMLSVILAVGGAALLTLVLPFHEMTAEIAARTAPTALDLFVAIFCALTAAYTTVRPGADSTAAAAGTAIGIALVPPLCAIGFGIGTASANTAGGAALLFTANLSAILVFAVVSFLALGYNQVDATSIEEGFLTDEYARTDRLATQAHRALGGLFRSRYSLAMRVAVPALFLAAVYFPLRSALAEVTWEVRTRDAIRRTIAAQDPGAVETSVTVERHTIALRLLIVGTSERAIALDSLLVHRIEALSGVTPTISVVPVADARLLAAATASRARREEPQAPSLDDVTRQVGVALGDAWPAAAGQLVEWHVTAGALAPPLVSVQHIGTPLDSVSTSLLASALSLKLGTRVRVASRAIRAAPIVMQRNRTAAWTDSAMALLNTIASTDSVVACVQSPAAEGGGRTADRQLLARVRTNGPAGANRLVVTKAGAWSIHASLRGCAEPTSRPGTATP